MPVIQTAAGKRVSKATRVTADIKALRDLHREAIRGLNQPTGNKYFLLDLFYLTPEMSNAAGGRSVSGVDLYDKRFFTNPEYYLADAGYNLINKSVDHFASLLRSPVRIFDFGSGNGAKTHHLLARLREKGVPLEKIRYVAVDKVGSYARAACARVAPVLGEGSTVEAVADKFSDCKRFMARRINSESQMQQVALEVGCTGDNTGYDEDKRFLSDVYSCMKPGDIFARDHDHTWFRQRLDGGYANEHVEEFSLNEMEFTSKLLGLRGLDPDKFIHGSDYDYKTNLYTTYLESIERQEVWHEGDGAIFGIKSDRPSIVVEKGERIQCYYGRKVSFEARQVEIRAAGFEVLHAVRELAHGGEVSTSLQIFQKPFLAPAA